MIVREFVLTSKENVLDLREYAEALDVGIVGAGSGRIVVWFRMEVALPRCKRRVIVVETSEEAPDAVGWDYVGTVVKPGDGARHVFAEKASV